jgi:hypothetical protein
MSPICIHLVLMKLVFFLLIFTKIQHFFNNTNDENDQWWNYDESENFCTLGWATTYELDNQWEKSGWWAA